MAIEVTEFGVSASRTCQRTAKALKTQACADEHSTVRPAASERTARAGAAAGEPHDLRFRARRRVPPRDRDGQSTW